MLERSKQGGLLLLLLTMMTTMIMMMMMMMMCVLNVHRLVRFEENKDQSDQIFQDIHRISTAEMTFDSKNDDASPNLGCILFGLRY
jgi:hypothetical protein